ncbi:hypothetical protein ACFOVU_04785 [Nocardiopsis sediminis]|uniref:Uncharacterized protein n=1 Tax=Nocardiopsis sediminis TaxID=1778267 RepID=A0ABV8FJY4_9ACTN
MSTKTRKTPARHYWGYLPFGGSLFGWLEPAIEPVAVIALSALSAFYFLLQVPVPCGAPNRTPGEFCRNNAPGILRGCHLQDHKWRRAALLIDRERRAELGLSFTRTWPVAIPVLAEIASIASGVAATAVHIISQAQ